MEKKKNAVVLVLLGTVLLGFLVWGIVKPDVKTSAAERRPLAQKPSLTLSGVLDGSFETAFESYTLDQFPMRDRFRTLKALTLTRLLGQRDNNGIYVADGYAAKLDYPVNEDSVRHAAERFQSIYEMYLAGTHVNVYAAVIPDKNYYLAGQNGYPVMDYERLESLVQAGLPQAQWVDISGTLSLDSFYRTDLHWRQEAILPAAEQLAEAMGVQLTNDFQTVTAEAPFYGIYCGQSALPLQPDRLQYLENDTLQGSTVYDYETGKQLPVYALEKLTGEDPYEVFLSGSKALLTITNPNAETDRELVIFRDSFASSLAPLLVPAYAKVTLVDIRYVQPERLGNWLAFDKQDVLFLYSATVLNNSETMK